MKLAVGQVWRGKSPRAVRVGTPTQRDGEVYIEPEQVSVLDDRTIMRLGSRQRGMVPDVATVTFESPVRKGTATITEAEFRAWAGELVVEVGS